MMTTLNADTDGQKIKNEVAEIRSLISALAVAVGGQLIGEKNLLIPVHTANAVPQGRIVRFADLDVLGRIHKDIPLHEPIPHGLQINETVVRLVPVVPDLRDEGIPIGPKERVLPVPVARFSLPNFKVT